MLNLINIIIESIKEFNLHKQQRLYEDKKLYIDSLNDIILKAELNHYSLMLKEIYSHDCLQYTPINIEEFPSFKKEFRSSLSRYFIYYIDEASNTLFVIKS